MFENILEVFLDALKDSAITFPILFLCYLLIELLEEKLLHRYQSSRVLRSKFAPVLGASIGLIPQCGFSIVASDLYSKRIITIGSLFAIFIATSDEALPIMLSNPNNYGSLAIILLIKFCYAIIVGLLIDVIFYKKNKRESQELSKITNALLTEKENKNNKHKHHKNAKTSKPELEDKLENLGLEEENLEKENALKTASLDIKNGEQVVLLNDENIKGCCHHKLEHESNKFKEIFLHPLKHSLIIFAYIFVINFVFGLLINFVGEDAISNFLSLTGFFEPFIATLVGLIPNCASSVIITELFIMGGISMGSCIAGLCVNSGLALVMLFKMNKNTKENILILLSLYLIGSVLGVVINLF